MGRKLPHSNKVIRCCYRILFLKLWVSSWLSFAFKICQQFSSMLLKWSVPVCFHKLWVLTPWWKSRLSFRDSSSWMSSVPPRKCPWRETTSTSCPQGKKYTCWGPRCTSSSRMDFMDSFFDKKLRKGSTLSWCILITSLRGLSWWKLSSKLLNIICSTSAQLHSGRSTIRNSTQGWLLRSHRSK